MQELGLTEESWSCDAAELSKLDPQMQAQGHPSQKDASSSKATGSAWVENERREKEANQARIFAGPRLAASKARTNIHKV